MNEEKLVTGNYKVVFGSNTILNSDGDIDLLKGINQEPFIFKLDRNDRLVLSCALRDQNGNIVVELKDSILQHINSDEYYIDMFENFDLARIMIINKFTGCIWLDFNEIDSNIIKLNGRFYIGDHKIVATDECLSINDSTRLSHNIKSNFNELITLHDGGGISF
jgi:hypothetical protein